MKQTAFYIGLTLVAISFIACVVSFYLLVFGIPTFLLGVILIFLSNQTIKTKLLDYQLDSIFVLTRELMTLDKNINVTEKRKPEVDYDGKYASVKLELFEYSVRKEIVISFDNDFIFQNRFYKLIDFLNSIINKK